MVSSLASLVVARVPLGPPNPRVRAPCVRTGRSVVGPHALSSSVSSARAALLALHHHHDHHSALDDGRIASVVGFVAAWLSWRFPAALR